MDAALLHKHRLCTVFKDLYEVREPFTIPIGKVLGLIQSGKTKLPIDSIRNNIDNPDAVRKMKASLPCILFSGEFVLLSDELVDEDNNTASCRTDDSIVSYSGLVPFDVDKIEDMATYIESKRKDPYIYALWKSPTATGVHGLIKIADCNRYKQHYNAILQQYPEFDPSCRNISRVLYMSYDEDIYINEESDVFFDLVSDSFGREVLDDSNSLVMAKSTDLKKVDIACRLIRGAPEGSKHNALIRASYLMGGYIGGGIVEEEVARMMLQHEISKRDCADLDAAFKTIEDGISTGKFRPLQETTLDYYDAVKSTEVIENELSFLASAKNDESFILKFNAGLIPSGLPFGMQGWDKHFLLKEGEFYGILGHATVGKTLAVSWLIFLSSVHHDWCWMIYTGENTSGSMKMTFIQFILGKKINNCTRDEIIAANRWLDKRFYFISTDNVYSYEEILNYAKVLAQYKTIKGVWIDPYNSLEVGSQGFSNKYMWDYKAYTDMLVFTKKTGITLFLSAHTNTMAQRSRDKDGNQVPPFPSDAEGGSVLMNRVDNFIVLHRNVWDSASYHNTLLWVYKIRNPHTGGVPTTHSDPLVMVYSGGGVEFRDIYGETGFNRSKLKVEL